MAYVANIVTVAEMQFYAGADINATGDADANHIILQDHAEAYLSSLLKYDLSVANWALLTTGTKEIISEWAARFAAIALISYAFTGAAAAITRQEAENRINVNAWRMEKIEELLKIIDTQQFLGTQ